MPVLPRRWWCAMLSRWLSRLGPLAVVVLAGVAAWASLFGQERVSRLAGSVPFLAAGAVVGLAGLWVGLRALLRRRGRSVASGLVHLGLALGIAGAAANELWSRSGFLLLEAGGGTADAYLERGFERLAALARPVALDSLGVRRRRGFQPAPVAYVSVAGRGIAQAVGYNRPLRIDGRELVFAGVVESGFLREYELSVDGDTYLLVHGQRVRLADGRQLASFAVDPEEGTLGLRAGGDTAWLRPGEERQLGPSRVAVAGFSVARARGAAFVVRDSRLRPLVFGGFGLTLLGMLLSVWRRRRG